MLKIIVKEDCGDSPKKELIRDFNIAFASNNTDEILEFMSDDIVWKMIGNKTITGKSAVKYELENMGIEEAQQLIIETIVAHGDSGAGNGEMRYEDMILAFCDVYKFSGHDKNAKIRELTSYGVELK